MSPSIALRRTGVRSSCNLWEAAPRDKDKTAGPRGPAVPSAHFALRGHPHSIRPALFAFRTEMVSGRASASDRHRMAMAFGAAPPSGTATFGDLDDQAIILRGKWNRRETCGARGSRESKS